MVLIDFPRTIQLFSLTEGIVDFADGKIRLTGLSGLSDFVEKAAPEIAANAMLCVVNQAAYLLRRQLESQSRSFLEKGGFTEHLYVARINARTSASAGDQPCCPSCGKPMLKRCAKNGPRAGEYFWGCSGYPNCKGTRPIEKARPKGQTSQTSPTSLTSPTASHPKLP